MKDEGLIKGLNKINYFTVIMCVVYQMEGKELSKHYYYVYHFCRQKQIQD